MTIRNTDIRNIEYSNIIPATFGLIALMDEHQKTMATDKELAKDLSLASKS